MPFLTIVTACSPSMPLNESEARGKQLFVQYCGSCHATVGDTLIVGPSLAGIATRGGTTISGLAARAYIEQSVFDPDVYINPGYNDLMPETFGNVLSDVELEALIDYLMTLE